MHRVFLPLSRYCVSNPPTDLPDTNHRRTRTHSFMPEPPGGACSAKHATSPSPPLPPRGGAHAPRHWRGRQGEGHINSPRRPRKKERDLIKLSVRFSSREGAPGGGGAATLRCLQLGGVSWSELSEKYRVVYGDFDEMWPPSVAWWLSWGAEEFLCSIR